MNKPILLLLAASLALPVLAEPLSPRQAPGRCAYTPDVLARPRLRSGINRCEA